MTTASATLPAGTTPPAPAGPVDWAGPRRLALGAAVIGFGVYAVGGVINLTAAGNDPLVDPRRDFFTAYLTGWVYWFSMPLGAVALLMIHYLAKTSWGLLLKRLFEAATRTLPVMAVLFVPVCVGLALHDHSPYWWSAPENAHAPDHAAGATPAPSGDHAKDAHDAKQAERNEASAAAVKTAVEHERHARDVGNYSFLSLPVYIGCSVAYFVVWCVLIYFLNKWSQDAENSPALVEPSLEKLKNISGPGLIIYAISITAASTQWVMSLQEGWASTMYPVIFAMNQFLTCFGFCLACFLVLMTRPPFRDVVREKFQLDMGSLLLAFTLLWSYTSFSQMMLIWIGNLPEEIPFFLKRSNNTGWWWVSAALLAFHFALPFLLLLYRDIKLHPVRLRMMAVYLLVICAVDVVWWVEPTHPHGSPLFILMDVGAILGIGGVWGLAFLYFLTRRPLLPTNETYMLPEGHHEHH